MILFSRILKPVSYTHLDVYKRQDIVCVGEMRSSEAYSAQEAARTGHTVLTTIHSNSCESTYRRMVTLCKRKYDISDETLMSLVTEAFPIIVFSKQLEDRKRKVMEIMECEILPDLSLIHIYVAEQCLTPEACGEIRPLLEERARMYDVKRAACFYQLIRYSYGSSCTSYGSQPFDIRRTFGPVSYTHLWCRLQK